MSDESDRMQCALWVWTHGSVSVVVCDSEAEAVRRTHGYVEEDTGAVAGVQRADGSFDAIDDWEALTLALVAAEAVDHGCADTPPPRRVRAPFDDRDGRPIVATVPGDTPDWVGRQEPPA